MPLRNRLTSPSLKRAIVLGCSSDARARRARSGRSHPGYEIPPGLLLVREEVDIVDGQKSQAAVGPSEAVHRAGLDGHDVFVGEPFARDVSDAGSVAHPLGRPTADALQQVRLAQAAAAVDEQGETDDRSPSSPSWVAADQASRLLAPTMKSSRLAKPPPSWRAGRGGVYRRPDLDRERAAGCSSAPVAFRWLFGRAGASRVSTEIRTSASDPRVSLATAWSSRLKRWLIQSATNWLRALTWTRVPSTVMSALTEPHGEPVFTDLLAQSFRDSV